MEAKFDGKWQTKQNVFSSRQENDIAERNLVHVCQNKEQHSDLANTTNAFLPLPTATLSDRQYHSGSCLIQIIAQALNTLFICNCDFTLTRMLRDIN